MAYIEGFFYYFLIVGISFLVFYFILFLSSFTFLTVKTTFKNKRIASFYEYKEIVSKIKNHKVFKFLIYGYLLGFIFFYMIQSFEYYGKDRAYPQAKAYKIVADINAFFFETFFASRNLFYKPSGIKYIEAYEKLQMFFINKGFAYIPKDDGERAVWKYEYIYANYIRARTAPIDFEKLNVMELNSLIKVGGHQTLYKQSAQIMIEDISSMVDLLLDGNIKDNTYKNVHRYTLASLYGVWIEEKRFLYYSLDERTYALTYKEIQKHYDSIDVWTEDTTYLKRVDRLLNLLDEVPTLIEKNKALKRFFKSHKYIYPELMGLRVALAGELSYVDLLYKEKLSCDMKSVQHFLKNLHEFMHYIQTDRVYKKFSWKETWHVTGLENHEGAVTKYFLYKKCNVTKLNRKLKFNWGDEPTTRTKKILERINNE